MNKKIFTAIIVLLVISILLNVALLITSSLGRTDHKGVTGFLTKLDPAIPFSEKDVVEINKDELSLCCSFINLEGEPDGCYVLEGYDCSHCSAFCE